MRDAAETRAFGISEGQKGGAFDLATVIGALKRRKWTVLMTVLLVNAAALSFLILTPPRFSATASLEIEPAETRPIGEKPIVRGIPDWMPGDNSNMDTQVNVVKAPALSARVVDKLGLSGDPEFRSLRAKLWFWVQAHSPDWPALAWLEKRARRTDPSDLAGAEPNRAAAFRLVREFQRRLSVQQQGTSHVIAVDFTSEDPAKAARIANAIALEYIDQQLAGKRRHAERAYEWVSAQLHDQREQLTAAENNLARYLAETGLLLANGSEKTPDGGLAVQQLTSLQGDLASARAQRATKEAKLEEVRRLAARGADFDSLPEVASSAIILELRKQYAAVQSQEAQLSSSYGRDSPVLGKIHAVLGIVSARISRETKSIIQNIENDVALARGREKAIEGMLNSGKAEYAVSQQTSVHLRELEQIASAMRANYQALLVKKLEIGSQRGLLEPDAKLLSAAVPPGAPSFPKPTIIAGGALFGSLVLGVMLAALAEHRDKRLHTGREAEEALGLPNLALIPKVALPDGGNLHTYVLRNSRSSYAEAVRSLLIPLLPARGTAASRVIAITSALPGEGKTSLTLSLAASATAMGFRAIAVDLDTRHPSIAREVGLSVRCGLTEFMAGEVRLEKAICEDPNEPRLHLLPLKAGEAQSDVHPESWDLRSLISNLRRSYDAIFVDLPPSIAMSDIQVVAHLADAAIFAVRWDKTSRPAAANGRDLLLKTGIQVIGLVLTQVDLARHAHFSRGEVAEYYKSHRAYFRE